MAQIELAWLLGRRREAERRRRTRRREGKRQSVQQSIDFERGKHGGRRPGAGRPRKSRRGTAHTRRPEINPKTPVHVSIRLRKRVRRNLPTRRIYAMLKKALRAARDRLGSRIVHYSVQGNHLHLLVEAQDAWCLSRAMKGFKVRIARGLNGIRGRKGSVFRERYYVTVIRDPPHARGGPAVGWRATARPSSPGAAVHSESRQAILRRRL